MSTVTSTTPRLITPTDQPVCPCWLWESSTARWHLFTEDTPGAWSPVWTHWVSVEATRPSPVAGLTIDSVTPEDRRLAAELHAQRGGDLTSIVLGVCHGRIRENERFIPPDGSTREWVPKDERDAAVAEEISRLKCAHSDMADLYTKERTTVERLTKEIDGYRCDRNRAVEISEKLDARVEQLKGQLEAAEQQVKALTVAQEAVTPEREMWRRWRAEANTLRAGVDGLRSLLGLPVNSGHNADRLHGLEVAIRELQTQLEEARSDNRAFTMALCKKQTPKPTKGMLRPWKPEEVPLGAWVRSKSEPQVRRLITEVYPLVVIVPAGIRLDLENPQRITDVAHATTLSYEALAHGYEHSTDGGKTWRPAGRVEQLEAAA